MTTMKRVLVVEDEMRYKGGANPRDNLTKSVYEVGAPLEAWLHYHHEMAYVGNSTRMLGFLAHQVVPGRGDTYVSDNVRATDAILETGFGQKLRELGLCYHRNLSDREAFAGTEEIGVYNHWQKSMLTEDPEEAEAKAHAREIVSEAKLQAQQEKGKLEKEAARLEEKENSLKRTEQELDKQRSRLDQKESQVDEVRKELALIDRIIEVCDRD